MAYLKLNQTKTLPTGSAINKKLLNEHKNQPKSLNG